MLEEACLLKNENITAEWKCHTNSSRTAWMFFASQPARNLVGSYNTRSNIYEAKEHRVLSSLSCNIKIHQKAFYCKRTDKYYRDGI